MAISALSMLITSLIILTVTASAITQRINKWAAALSVAIMLLIEVVAAYMIPGSLFYDFRMLWIVAAYVAMISTSTRGAKMIRIIYLVFVVVGLDVSLSSLLYCICSVVLLLTVSTARLSLAIEAALFTIVIIAARNGRLNRIVGSILEIGATTKALLLGSIWSSALLSSLVSSVYQNHPDIPGLALTGVFVSFLFVVLSIAFPVLIANSLSRKYYADLSSALDKQVHTQVWYYEEMSRRNEEVKRFMHDSKNLRLGILNALEQNDIESAISMLGATERADSERNARYETGSIVLNALLAEKQASVKDADIAIRFDGVVPADCIAPADICVVFGNVLDNAIEACSQCPAGEKKVVDIRTEFVSGALFIVVTNPVASDVKIVNNSIATTKDAKAAHGLGLQSIKMAIGRYSGTMQLACEGGVFSIAIRLNLNGIISEKRSQQADHDRILPK